MVIGDKAETLRGRNKEVQKKLSILLGGSIV